MDHLECKKLVLFPACSGTPEGDIQRGIGTGGRVSSIYGRSSIGKIGIRFFFLFRYADFPTLGRLDLFATPQLVFVWLT